jgi:SAM-dependent methyltransferase
VRRLLVASLIALARTLDRGITVCTFAAGGLLRFETLGRHRAENWRHFGASQAEADVAAGLFGWEQRFYGRFLKARERVLVVGCGTGRDLLPLLEQGHRAEGLEPVAVCAEQARERVARTGRSAPIYTADIVTAALTGRYDVVIFSWLCYSYIPTRTRRIAVLRKVRDHLAPDGRVLISYVLSGSGPRRVTWRLAHLVSRLTRSDWRPEYGDVFVLWPDTRCIHLEHHFRPAEIEGEAHAAGFEIAFHERGSDGSIALVPAGAPGPDG